MNTSRLSISTRNGLKFLKEEQILYVISEGNYTTLYLTDNQRFTSSKKLKDLSSILSSEDFFRIHHSHLINLNHLLEYHNESRNFVVMRDGKKLDVSKRKSSDFLKLFRKI